jgi:hypothetical protein
VSSWRFRGARVSIVTRLDSSLCPRVLLAMESILIKIKMGINQVFIQVSTNETTNKVKKTQLDLGFP